MTPKAKSGQLLGPGRARRVLEAGREASSLITMLKVGAMQKLWTETSLPAGTSVLCHDHCESMQWRQLNVFNIEWAIFFRCREDAVATMAACKPRSGAKSGAGDVRLGRLERTRWMGLKKRVTLKKNPTSGN